MGFHPAPLGGLATAPWLHVLCPGPRSAATSAPAFVRVAAGVGCGHIQRCSHPAAAHAATHTVLRHVLLKGLHACCLSNATEHQAADINLLKQPEPQCSNLLSSCGAISCSAQLASPCTHGAPHTQVQIRPQSCPHIETLHTCSCPEIVQKEPQYPNLLTCSSCGVVRRSAPLASRRRAAPRQSPCCA